VIGDALTALAPSFTTGISAVTAGVIGFHRAFHIPSPFRALPADYYFTFIAEPVNQKITYLFLFRRYNGWYNF
jgi:hypothetical protein